MDNNEAFAAQINFIINKLIFLEKKGILDIEGIRLFPSEIHLMEVIAGDRTINAKSMANKLGISKGAVSQTLSRLKKKGIVNKVRDNNNKNELTAHFTELGKKAVEQHHNMRASLQKEYLKYLDSISGEDKQVIKDFLKHIGGFVDRLG